MTTFPRSTLLVGALGAVLLPTAGGVATASPAAAAGTTPRCIASVLALSHTRHDLGAGQSYERLVLRNVGRHTCHLRGFPGVSYVVAAGRQVSAAASFTDQRRVTVVLPPGRSAFAVLHAINVVDAVPGCSQPAQQVRSLGLRVYPPGSSLAMYVPDPHPACTSPTAHLLDVGPLRAS